MSAVVAVPVQSQIGLDTANLYIDNIISHRVFARDSEKVVKDPILSDRCIKLQQDGLDAIQQRLTAALGSRSHGIEMSIEKTDIDSFLQLAADAIAQKSKDTFVSASKEIAKRLSAAQAGTSGTAGVVFAITGHIGKNPKRFIAVIKAEVHDGFGAGNSDEDVVVYLKSLVLTPTQRLYKVGLLLELKPCSKLSLGEYSPSNYRAFLFDHLITATETRSAAAYFYFGLLGMGIQKSSKKLTQDFFERTEAFIKTASITDDTKWELREALRVELRSSSGLISADDFSKQYIEDEDLRDSYCEYLEKCGFPKNAVPKDVTYVKSRLRRPRRWFFTSGVKLEIPPDASKDVVTIEKCTEAATIVRINGSYIEKD